MDFNGEEIKLIPCAGIHSDADLIIYLTDSGVVHMGDLLISESFPAVGANVVEYMELLEKIIDIFPAETIFISGHGKDYTLKDVKNYQRMLLTTIEMVRNHMKAGKSVKQMRMEKVLKDYDAWSTFFVALNTDFWIQAVYNSYKNREEEAAVSKQNYITFSRIDKAWEITKGVNTKVAILDWLFDTSPEALKKYENPTSLVPGEPIGMGEPWHGEWMAEIVHRIAPEAKIIPIRARPSKKPEDNAKTNRQAYEKYLIEGIRFAADQGAVAVTNSMGPVKHSEELKAAIDYAERKGTVFINVHPEYILFTKETYEVCAPDEIDRRIIHPGLVSVPKYPVDPEPGRDVYVWPYQINPEFKDGWGYSNGPPIVGGVVALMKSVNPDLSPKEIRRIIVETANNKEVFNVLDAEAAVKKAMSSKDCPENPSCY